MDGSRFDGLTRILGSLSDRRSATGLFAGSALAALGLAAGHGAHARKKKKKKKKCKRPRVKCGKACCAKGQRCLGGRCAVPCAFVTAGAVMTLQASCTTTATIEVPDGATLEGDGKTIRLAGGASGFLFGGVANVPGAASFTVQNLTVDGSGLSRPCDAPRVVGIGCSAAECELENVTVENLCAPAVSAGGGPLGQSLAVLGSAFRNNTVSQDGAIALFAPVEATITDSAFSGIPNGYGVLAAAGGVTATVADSTFEDVRIAAEVRGESNFTISGNQMLRVNSGASADEGSAMAVTGNTIVGPGSGRLLAGVYFGVDTTGEVSGNAISNFLDSGQPDPSCGIWVEANAGAVAIGANTFPVPPGNEQNVCDYRA